MADSVSRAVIDPVKVAEVLRGPNGPVARRLIEDGEIVKLEARRLVGVSKPDPVPRRGPQRRPGTLRDSIVKRIAFQRGEIVVEVGSNDPVALWHHEGTRPHTITPVKASRLVFWSGRAGRVVYAKVVHHPGTRPNRFLVNALRALRGRY